MAFEQEDSGTVPGLLHIVFEEHVTIQHAWTIIDMVGGRLAGTLSSGTDELEASITIIEPRTKIVMELLNVDENVKSVKQGQHPEIDDGLTVRLAVEEAGYYAGLEAGKKARQATLDARHEAEYEAGYNSGQAAAGRFGASKPLSGPFGVSPDLKGQR